MSTLSEVQPKHFSVHVYAAEVSLVISIAEVVKCKIQDLFEAFHI